jgi:hypothetical protein
MGLRLCMGAGALLLAAAGLVAPTAASGSVDSRTPAGPTGNAIVLADGQQVHAVDVAMDLVGTAYVGWIASNSGAAQRFTYLCVLPQGATQCSGGVRSTYASGSGESGLRVLTPVDRPVSLLWFQDTPDSVNGPMNARLLRSEYAGGVLGDPQSVAAAPSFGSLKTAEVGPDGLIYAVTAQAPGQGNDLQVTHGLGKAPVTLAAPWLTGRVALGFHDSLPVLVTHKAGAVADPLQVARLRTNGSWSPFTKVTGTWAVGNANGGAFDLGQARSGLRLVASVDDARYFPQVARWTGTKFGSWSLTGDRSSCAPTSHDLYADSSGRLADASFECTKIAVVNQPKAGKAAVTRFDVGGTPAGDPQIATSPRGDGWVAWTVTKPGGGHLLRVRPVMLPALSTTKRKRVDGGRALLTGPVSCLPAVDTRVGVRAKPAQGWKVKARKLRLDGAPQGKVLDGAALAPGSKHALTGRVVFAKGGQRSRAAVKLTFTSCPAPAVL